MIFALALLLLTVTPIQRVACQGNALSCRNYGQGDLLITLDGGGSGAGDTCTDSKCAIGLLGISTDGGITVYGTPLLGIRLVGAANTEATWIRYGLTGPYLGARTANNLATNAVVFTVDNLLAVGSLISLTGSSGSIAANNFNSNNTTAGTNSINLADGTRANFSTGDPNAYWYRSALNTLRTPGLVVADTSLAAGPVGISTDAGVIIKGKYTVFGPDGGFENAILWRGPGTSSQMEVEFGDDTFVAGTKTITFDTPFGLGVSCFCTDGAGAGAACGRGAQTSTTQVFVGTGTNLFSWYCIGRR